MSADTDSIPWDEVESAARKMFNVWANGSELEWAKECWAHLSKAGLASRGGPVETTTAFLRLVALAQIYQEFCELAWDENPDAPLPYLAEDLEIEPVALGILAASKGDEDFLSADDEYELKESALAVAVSVLRPELYSCLIDAYGGAVPLYSRLSRTNQPSEEDDDEDEFDVTGPNARALEYVTNGFLY